MKRLRVHKLDLLPFWAQKLRVGKWLRLSHLAGSRCGSHAGTGGQESDFTIGGRIDDPMRHLPPTTMSQLMFVGTNPSWLDAVPGAITRIIMNAEDLKEALSQSEQERPQKKRRTGDDGDAAAAAAAADV